MPKKSGLLKSQNQSPSENFGDIIQDPILASYWLAAIVESAEDAIISKTLDGIITSWNKGAENVFGYTAQEIVGKSISILFPPERYSEEPKIIEEVKKGNKIEHYETVRLRKNGEPIDISLTISPIKNSNGEIIGVSKIARQIGERKKTVQMLRESEQRYRALIEATATTVWHANPEGALTFVGDSWTQVSGQRTEEMLQAGWLDALHPDDREQTVAIWRDALEKKALYSTQFRILTTKGEYRWFAASAVPVLSEDGSIREWVGSNVDIDDRKRAEEERVRTLAQLEIERSRLVYVFEKAPAFVAILHGADHVYELTNPAYMRLIGHRNVIGKTIRAALPELDGQGYFELLDKVYETGEPFIGNEMAVEIQYVPDSPLEKRFVNFVFQPMFGADDKSSGIFVHGVDITEQVKARQAAEQANRLKDEFLATLSHELRTPLNSILGWSQILQNGSAATDEIKKALAIIERNARAQNQLIEDILDVSRIITGKLRLDVRAVDLIKIISAAVDTARPAAAAKNIRLQTLLDPKVTVVSGDPDRLQQVIWNLLSNAVKFTPKDGRVQIRLERINSHVEIVVSDTGKGIEPEFLPYVFDRFRQLDGSMTRRQGGLGLGLAIVRQIVELHGGTVSVISEGPGQGAIFTVCLPVLPIRQEPKGEILRVHPAAQNDNSDENSFNNSAELSGRHILIVDDEDDSRDLLDAILTTSGATVKSAGSAVEALEVIKNERFDVIISDIGMPNEDGFSFIRKVRELPAETKGNTPAIALTAYARAEDRIKALRSGFQLHIAKPVDHAELLAAIINLTAK